MSQSQTPPTSPVHRVVMRVEFKIEDSWIGAFWKRGKDEEIEIAGDERTAVMVTTPRLDVWICFVPWFPLHIVVRGCSERSDAMRYIADRHIDDIIKDSGWERLPVA